MGHSKTRPRLLATKRQSASKRDSNKQSTVCVCVALSVCFVLPCFVVSTSLRAQINYTHTHARIHIRHFSRLLVTLPLTKSIALSLSHTHTGHVQAKDHDPQICRAPQARRDGKA